jgi:hypothetical protein
MVILHYMYRSILSQINNTLERLRLNNEKPFYKRGDFYFSVVLSIVAIILTIFTIIQAKQISGQQQQIKGFDALLNYSKIQTDTLNKAIKILSAQLPILAGQLKLNEEQQKMLNLQAGYINDANETKFRLAEYNLRLLIWSPNRKFLTLVDWDSTSRKKFLSSAERIIKNELDNPFLLKTPEIAKKWNELFGKISNYYFVSTFDASWQDPRQLKKDLDITWRACYISTAQLWQDTNEYLRYITYHKFNQTQYKSWYYNSPDSSYLK